MPPILDICKSGACCNIKSQCRLMVRYDAFEMLIKTGV
jgi:hypothetical protein